MNLRNSIAIAALMAPAAAAALAADPVAGGATGTEPAAPEVKPDPFANLPLVRVGETDNVIDFSGVATSAPRKYGKIAEDAAKDNLPIQRGWKHMTAMFIPGTNKGGENGFKQGSVYGTIADIVKRAGKAGISAHELVSEVRKAQVGNKRSHYCDALPPVGWVEGWVNTAVTKNIVGVHTTKKAPALTIADVAAKGTEATDGQTKAVTKA